MKSANSTARFQRIQDLSQDNHSDGGDDDDDGEGIESFTSSKHNPFYDDADPSQIPTDIENNRLLSSSEINDDDDIDDNGIVAINDTNNDKRSLTDPLSTTNHLSNGKSQSAHKNSIDNDTTTYSSSDNDDSNITPLPRDKLFVLALMQLCESISLVQIFPYVSFMIMDFFHLTPSEHTRIGYYAGFLAASFMMGQFFSSLVWGRLSDKYGRRPILLFGALGTTFAQIMFGFSASFWWAIMSRTLHGLLNGNIGVIKTYLAEITDDTNKAKAFSLIALVAGAGRIVGPIIGGFLSQPAIKYPNLMSKDSFFGRHPYSLPCLIAALISFTSFALGYFWLPESTRFIKRQESQKGRLKNMKNNNNNVHPMIVGSVNNDGIEDDGNDVEMMELTKKNNDDQEEEEIVRDVEEDVEAILSVSPATALKEEKQRREMDRMEFEPQSSLAPFSIQQTLETTKDAARQKLRSSGSSASSSTSLSSSSSSTTMPSLTSPEISEAELDETFGWFSILRDRKILICTCLYGLLGQISICWEELFSIWSVQSPANGGLNFSSSEIGSFIALAGFITVVFQWFIFPPIAKRISILALFQWGMILGLPSALIFPNVTYLLSIRFWIWGSENMVLWSVLCIFLIVRYTTSNLSFTAVFILISNSAPTWKLGAVNGLGQSIVALGRGIGPAPIGIIFSWSLRNGLPFPFDFRFAFLILGCLSMLTIGISMLLPPSINRSIKR